MKSTMGKTTFREIKNSFGRYFAIMAIIALGVGFFSGLKVTKTAMVVTANDYLTEHKFFDYRLISTMGFDIEDVEVFQELDGVMQARGAIFKDIICEKAEGGTGVFRAHSITEDINELNIVKGRLPENAKECVVDQKYFETNVIGDAIVLSNENSDSTFDLFVYDEYKIVGIVNSPYYLNYQRGSTAVGNGVLSGFIYIPESGFSTEHYSEIYVTMEEKYDIYSKEYENYIESNEEIMEQTLEIETAQPEGTQQPEGYVLGRNTNVGYASFESDSSIVESIANVFPIFFFLVAALVCITTMNRMVEEQRTQIGVLKALGYGESAIMGKYIVYSGSGAMIGCIGGFLIGSFVMPKVIWITYNMMYGFSDIEFVFDIPLFIISILVSLLCSIGTTWFSCRHELKSKAAELIRPKAPKNGKRIFLERVPFIWKRLNFLVKVSIRNIVRYKKRFFMMVLGISGCTALVLTGFGIKDSIANVANQQYEEIQIYDIHISFAQAPDETMKDSFQQETSDFLEEYSFTMEESVDLEFKGNVKSLTMVVAKDTSSIGNFINLHGSDGTAIVYPSYGEVVLTQKIAEKYSIKVGDTVVLRDSDLKPMEVTVSAICENYFMTYAYIGADTYEGLMNKQPEYKWAMGNVVETTDLHESSAGVMNVKNVTGVTINQDTKEQFTQMMSSLDYIVIMVIICAGALAFIVLYNLTNINITERIREIATIKVLGFYPGETAAYVFRENVVLTGIGALVGLILGKLLHQFVMYNIDIDMIHFDVHVATISYFYSIGLTFAFAIFVNVIMYFKLKKINMAESLKSIE